jgi:1-aminocyclopropane-1-carboxylate deaminase
VWLQVDQDGSLVVPEGGYGIPGRTGAENILQLVDASAYTHILAGVGTGTMLAGLITAAPEVQVIGISAMKDNLQLQQQINDLLDTGLRDRFTLKHGYSFGGYAKKKPQLFAFMNAWYSQTRIPSDFVYTAKVFYALNDLISKDYFPPQSRILVVHSGGLQGNNSLPNGTLIF